MAAGGTATVVLVALGVNLGIALAKFAAAAYTGSSAMLSQAIHSLVDTSNQGLLLYGLTRSARGADEPHPPGRSRELYFWSYIVAILLFSMGAGVSIYEGVHKLHDPHPVTRPEVSYIVLGIAVALVSLSTWKVTSQFNSRRNGWGLVTALSATKDPALFTIVIEGAAALAGLAVAILGILIAHLGGVAQADGFASIVIGLILAAVAAFMSIEVQALIVGKAASAETMADLNALIAAEMGDGKPVRDIGGIRTMRLGPDDVLVAARLDFHDGETAQTVQQTISRLERAIKARHPEVQRLCLEAWPQLDHTGPAPAAVVSKAKTATAPVSTEQVAGRSSTASPPITQSLGEDEVAHKPTLATRPPGARKKGKRHKR